MSNRTLIIKLDNNYIYLAKDVFISYVQTNLPKTEFKFKLEHPIFWELEQTGYSIAENKMSIKVLNFSCKKIDGFYKQSLSSHINYLAFEPLNWRLVEPLILSYTLSNALKLAFYNTERFIENTVRRNAINRSYK